MAGYTCKVCGEYHDELPMSYGAAAPAYWYGLPEAERSSRAQLTPDLCVIDDQHYFVAGNLEIPIVDSESRFQWAVWVSLSAQNYQRTVELFRQEGRENEPPYFGWLSTEIGIYPETLKLKTMVHTNVVGVRPSIELEPTGHPLAVEQRQGITMARVQEIAELIEHLAES